MRSLTNEETIFPNAPPMIMSTPISTTFPHMANFLNSFSMGVLLFPRAKDIEIRDCCNGTARLLKKRDDLLLHGKPGYHDLPRSGNHDVNLAPDPELLRQVNPRLDGK